MKTFEDFYVKKDYANALKTLEKHANELPKDLLHYNQGTVHSQLENWGMARYHFMMAEEAGFARPALLKSQGAVEKKLEIERLERPSNASDHLIKTSLLVKDGILTSLSLLILFIGLLGFRRNATLGKVALWSVIVMIPVMLGFWINSWPRHMVIRTANVSEGPSAIFNSNVDLPVGVMVIVRGEGEWREVIYPSRFKGWIKASALKKLE